MFHEQFSQTSLEPLQVGKIKGIVSVGQAGRERALLRQGVCVCAHCLEVFEWAEVCPVYYVCTGST